MEFYLAARIERQYEIGVVAENLESLGHSVVSTWHRRTITPDRESQAKLALSEILKSDCVVVFGEPLSRNYGERSFAAGVATAMNKLVVVVDTKENYFYHLPDVFYCRDIEQLLEAATKKESALEIAKQKLNTTKEGCQ